MEKKPPVRVNTRISHNLNEWLDERSLETAMSKSSLINLAIENYRKEVTAIDVMPQILAELERRGIDPHAYERPASEE